MTNIFIILFSFIIGLIFLIYIIIFNISFRAVDATIIMIICYLFFYLKTIQRGGEDETPKK